MMLGGEGGSPMKTADTLTIQVAFPRLKIKQVDSFSSLSEVLINKQDFYGLYALLCCCCWGRGGFGFPQH